MLNSKVCTSNEQVRTLVEDFQEKIENFSYKIISDFEESVDNEKNGVTDKEISLPNLIETYQSSVYRRGNAIFYLEYLEKQINLINTFFRLTHSMRYHS